jgi:hypothetical protein
MEYRFEKDGDPDCGNGKILDIDKIHAMENAVLEKYDKKAYNEFLCGKLVNFVRDKEILDSFIRNGAEYLDYVGKYALLMFGGLIVLCFEHPMFKSRDPGNGKEDEMTKYIDNFMEDAKYLISGLRDALAFSDDGLKQEYEEFIRQNDLLTEEEPVYEDIYGVLAHYSTKQPVLRDYIAELVFTSPLESAPDDKIFLFTYLFFIIDFLGEYYFEIP